MKQAERRKFHYIYKITRTDGKYYIGMHSTDDLEDGYFGSGQLLWKSIKKHGKEKHSKEILEFLPTRQELKTRERELVNEEIVNDPLCMNLKLGGEGGWDHIPIDREVMRQRGALGGKVGGKTAGKMQCGRNWGSKPGWNGNHKFGTHLSEAHKKAMSGPMSIAQSGEKNSQFGTCWVTNGVKPIKIKKENLDEHLANGYRRGRK